jgi:hypothetical protein
MLDSKVMIDIRSLTLEKNVLPKIHKIPSKNSKAIFAIRTTTDPEFLETLYHSLKHTRKKLTRQK